MGRNLKQISFPRLDDPLLAYFCGVMAGDGNLHARPIKKDYAIYCGGNPFDEVPYYNEVIGPLVYSLFGIKVKLKLMNTTYGFSTSSKLLFEFLTHKIGLPPGPKHPSLRVPSIFKADETLMSFFVRGLFDTGGCVYFSKKQNSVSYYPVISCSSKTDFFMRQIANFLKSKNFRVYEYYNYKFKDARNKRGYTIKSGIQLSGRQNLQNWVSLINFSNPKHLQKIEKYNTSI